MIILMLPSEFKYLQETGQLKAAVDAQNLIANTAKENLRAAEKKLYEADLSLNSLVNELQDAETVIKYQTELDHER